MDWQSVGTTCKRRRTSPLTSNTTRPGNRNTTTYSRNLRRFRPHRSRSTRNRGAHAVLVTTRPATSYSRIHCMPPPHHLHSGSDYHYPHVQPTTDNDQFQSTTQPQLTTTTIISLRRPTHSDHYHLPQRTKILTANQATRVSTNHDAGKSTTYPHARSYTTKRLKRCIQEQTTTS